MNEFKTFIASSLRPEFLDHREKIVQALQTLNEDPDLQPLSFTSYRFESEGSNASCIGGIQNHINLDIAECHGFVLICDSNIGKKTVEEFEKALERFNKHLNPSFVIILKSKVSTPCGPNQITYEKFKSDYLTIFDYNHDGKINDDVIDYEFEFDNIDSACDKLKKDLKEWITNKNNRPLFKAELGRHITSEFLYTDKGRIKECTDQIYFRRHFDNMLDKAIREKEAAILIKGASLSGKTRALYQAIKNAPDTWFYKFKERHDKIKMAAEIEEIAEYLEFARSSMPICLIFDDVHQLSTCAEVVKAIDRLMDAINGKEVSIIMTSTSSDDSLIPATKSLRIKPLSRKECSEAVLFFRRFGKFVNSEYKEIGAMMIDLESMKRRYKLFKEDEDPLYSTSRTCLLEAIKASSIWHSSNIGNVSLLIDFTNYLLSLKPSMKEVDFHALTDKNILDLLKLPGINKDENTETIYLATEGSISQHILIEEYIYRYVLPHQTIEQEWRLINQILSFVNNSNTPPESLIVSLSKIARRAENHDAVVRTIYDLVMSIFLEDESKCPRIGGQRLSAMPWYNKLKEGINEIKREIEVNPTAENEDCSKDCIYMAKIIWSRMLLEETYEGAERMFNSVPYPLQNLPMLGILIFKSSGNQEKLKALIQSRNLEKSFYIINKMIPHASDFDEALSYFQNGELPYESKWDYIDSATDMRQMVETREMQGEEWEELKIKDINRQQFILALNSLATKVRCLGDLEKLLDVIKTHYIYLLDDLEYATNYLIAEDKYSIKKLTWIDLLSCLNFYCLRHAFTDIMTWGKQLPPDLPDLTGLIIQEYARTSELTTVGYKAKQVVCAIFNVFIEKCNECPYEDVLENVFKKMYVQKGDRMVNLCDSYTYSSMMRNRNCKYIDALDLYNNFIEPHSKARDGHFIITHFILNEILNKVRSVAEYNKINRIFIENNVAKDIYTYNVVLRNLSYSMGVSQILPQMHKDGIEVDIYTLGTLISKAPNIRIATSFFYPLLRNGIKSEDNQIPGDLSKMMEGKIKEYTHILPLESQHYLWASLVEGHCRNDEDREILKKVLEFLELPKNRSKIFGEHDKGIIYNNCLKNRSFIRNYEEAEEFITSKHITADAYTLSHLISIILNDYKDSAGYDHEIPNYLNKIYRKNRSLLAKELAEGNSFLYNERLKAYKSHDDKLSFVFIYPDGTEEEMALTPMEYIRNLWEHGLPVDQYTLSSFADIAEGQTYDLLKDFLAFVKANNLYVNHYGIDFLIRNFKKIIPENERIKTLSTIFELPIKDDLTSPSKATINMFANGLCSLTEAFERVDGNDTEKLYRYTQLLSQFRKTQLGRKHATDSDDFAVCMDMYSKFVKDAHIKPNVDFFSNIANFATTIDELKTVFKEMKTVNVIPISYILTPILRVSENIDNIKELIEEYIRMGGTKPNQEGSETEVDTILRGLGIIWRRNKDTAIHKLATELTEYVLSSAPSSTALKDMPFFSIYKQGGDHLTQNALCELINFWPYLEDESKVNETYLEYTSALLGKYYRPDNDSIRPRLAQAINYVVTKLGISSIDILKVLKPYPKLAFMFASEKPVDGYEAYKLMVESWIEGYEKISQDYAIDVLLTQFEKSEDLFAISKNILIGIYKKWKTGLTTADFLIPEDTIATEHKEVTEYAECDRLRRRYLESKLNLQIAKQQFNSAEYKVKEYIRLFKDELTDASFIKSALGEFAKRNNLKFDHLRPVLETVSGNKECIDAVLCCMAGMSSSYANLRYMIEIICSESVDPSEDLAQRLTFGILRKRYDDFKYGLIAGQILRAVGEDRLQLNDLLYVPTSLPHENLQKKLKLPKETKRLYKLLHNLSAEVNESSSREMIEHAENLINRYYHNLHEGKSKLDSLVAQEFLRIHVVAHNKKDGKEYTASLLEKIESIMSVPAGDKNPADMSILFSENTKQKLNKEPKWYTINSLYISKIIISHLNCSNEKKLDMIIASNSQKYWWSNAFKGNFDKLMSYADIVESRITEARPKEFINNLFCEVQKPEDFIKALKLVLSGRIKYCNVNNIVDSLLRILGKDEAFAHQIVRYNSMRYNTQGKQATITSDHCTWTPDSGFFNYIFGAETLDESSDFVLKSMFKNPALIAPISKFVSEMMVMKELQKAIKGRTTTDALNRYISFNSTYFNHGGKIDNGLLTATYIRYMRSESDIVKQILNKSTYNASMLPALNDRTDLFDGKMSYHVFKGLSEIVELNYERKFSRITTQKLFHKLLYGCGNDFVLNNQQLLIEVANTIRSAEEYLKFTEDLMKFYIPVSQELTATLIEKLSSLASNDSWKWILGVVRNRAKALAEFDHYHQGTDCHAFKAGFLLLQQESKIDFGNFWVGQNLHLKNASTEETVKSILSQKFTDRVNSVMAIESIALRCEVILKLYVKNFDNMNFFEKKVMWNKLDLTFEELANTLNGPKALKTPINAMIRIFTTMTKNNIRVKKELGESMLLGLINYYHLQRHNEALGPYYKNNVNFVLNRISEICDKVQDGEYIKIYYSLFTNNKVKYSEAYFMCGINTVKNALSD